MHRINRSPCLVRCPMSRLKLTGVVIDEANFENQTFTYCMNTDWMESEAGIEKYDV